MQFKRAITERHRQLIAVLAVVLSTVIVSSSGQLAQSQQPHASAVQPGGIALGSETSAPTDPALELKEASLRASAEHAPSASTLYELALVLREENKARESLEIYTRAAQIQKPDVAQLRSVALDYVLLGDYDDAVRWLRVAVGINPDDKDVLYSLGRCLYTKNLFPEAEKAYLRLLALDPSNLKAEENLGLTYDAQSEPVPAEKALNTAVGWARERKLQDPWPYLDLGIFLLGQARATDAQPMLERAVELAPKSAWAHEKLGMAMVANGHAENGVRQLQIATDLEPKDPKAHFELGRAYRAAGREDMARAEFDLSKSLYGEHSRE